MSLGLGSLSLAVGALYFAAARTALVAAEVGTPLRVVGPVSGAQALSAHALVGVARRPVCVRVSKGVTVDALLLPLVDSRCADAAQYVLASSDNLHVERIDAGPIPTQVVDGEIRRDGPDENFVCKAMRQELNAVLLPSSDVILTVAATENCAGPLPAPRRPVDSGLRDESRWESCHVHAHNLTKTGR